MNVSRETLASLHQKLALISPKRSHILPAT
jgi:hypothetical protein